MRSSLAITPIRHRNIVWLYAVVVNPRCVVRPFPMLSRTPVPRVTVVFGA
ncbi:MAG: hypothetical protein ACJ0BT_00375 [Pseudohongiellaceae bacterium]